MAEPYAKRGYHALQACGELQDRRKQLTAMLGSCTLCPHKCGVNRLEGEVGLCRTGVGAGVASHGPHFGEEAPLSGSRGSGTIFFTGCNLLCVYCQNCDISHIHTETERPPRPEQPVSLAAIMLELQELGCHNINFVTPSHTLPQILEAVEIASEKGLHLPLVYNSGGYDSVESLQLIDGVFDIYMPDIKFFSNIAAARYTTAADYRERVRASILEMHRQVGELERGPDDLAVRGILVRHLVMPGMLSDSRHIFQFLAESVSPDTYINIMDQYHPCGDLRDYPELQQPLGHEQYQLAVQAARDAGLNRLDQKGANIFARLFG